jgi:hypothetical protein
MSQQNLNLMGEQLSMKNNLLKVVNHESILELFLSTNDTQSVLYKNTFGKSTIFKKRKPAGL